MEVNREEFSRPLDPGFVLLTNLTYESSYRLCTGVVVFLFSSRLIRVAGSKFTCLPHTPCTHARLHTRHACFVLESCPLQRLNRTSTCTVRREPQSESLLEPRRRSSPPYPPCTSTFQMRRQVGRPGGLAERSTRALESGSRVLTPICHEIQETLGGLPNLPSSVSSSGVEMTMMPTWQAVLKTRWAHLPEVFSTVLGTQRVLSKC